MIKLENVSFSYPTTPEGEKVLKNLNLNIEDGEFVAILGHNGCGKSTLAKLLNAIYLPTEGRVLVNGMDTKCEEHLFDIRKRVGMVFQNPDNQIVATIVEEDVAFGPENLGIESQEIRKRVDAALKAVKMYEFKDRAPHLLSGGQKQRVAIAGTLAMHPSCIVLDESTAMLDPSGRKEVLDTVRRLNAENNITIILITHNMDEAVRAKRVIVMNEGTISLDGNPHEVFSNVEFLKSVHLDVPQVTMLAHEIVSQKIEFNEKVLRTREFVEEFIKRNEGAKK